MKKKLAALALALWALAGCSSPDAAGINTGGSTAADKDSGIARCEKIKAAAADENGDDSMPTDKEFDEVEADFRGSRYSDLKRAGLSFIAAVKSYTEDSADVNLADLSIKKRTLDATCAKHGVVIVVATPTFEIPSMPPRPTFDTEPVPYLPMPTR